MSTTQLKVEIDEALKDRVAELKGETTWRDLVEGLLLDYVAGEQAGKVRDGAYWLPANDPAICVAVEHCMNAGTRVQNARAQGAEALKIVQHQLVEEVRARLRVQEG